MSVHRLSYLKYTVMGSGKQKLKNGIYEGSEKNKWPSWVSHSPDSSLIYNHCLPILISLIREQTVATLPGLQEGKSLATRGHSAEVQWTSSTRAIIFTDFVAAALTWKSLGLSLDTHLGSGLLVWVSFEGSNFRREENSIRRSSTCGPLWIGVPEEVGKRFCFHNIPKSWMTPKTFQLSV